MVTDNVLTFCFIRDDGNNLFMQPIHVCPTVSAATFPHFSGLTLQIRRGEHL